MAKIEKDPARGTIRGLGCGGHADKPAGKVKKICVDCGARTEEELAKIVCDTCGGPLSSSYDD